MRIVVMSGDGIGAEITGATLCVLGTDTQVEKHIAGHARHTRNSDRGHKQ